MTPLMFALGAFSHLYLALFFFPPVQKANTLGAVLLALSIFGALYFWGWMIWG